MAQHEAHESAICKNCLTPIPAATNAESSESRGPSEGDFSICFNCATIGRYTEDLMVEPMSDIEQEIFAKENPEEWDEVVKAVTALKLFKRKHD